jgi:hypothetical protein
MADIKIRIQYSEEDLQKAYEAHFYSYHPFKTRLLLILGVLCIGYSLFLIIIALVRNEDQVKSYSVAFLVYGVIITLYYKWKMSRMGKNIFRKVKEFEAPLSYHISQDFVRVVAGNGTSTEMSWNSFTKALIKKDMLLLYPNQINFLMFPSGHFQSAEFEELKKLVKNKVPAVLEK